ncbi:MAG TPA: hypothetical protein VHJ39_16725 [Solirubrobacteraceae bacterium]|jgi:hypothetical protein|nr:hypothetical protein [Solirubrobacteraceae bacterium]
MEDVRRPRHVVLYVFALAALVALVAAVSSWAAGDPAPAQSTTPTQSIEYGAPDQSQAPGADTPGRHPCPEDEQGGQGGQQGGQGSDSTV